MTKLPMKVKIKTNPYRLLFQVVILILLIYMLLRPFADNNYTADFEAYCPFGGLMAFTSFLLNDSLACSMTSVQIVMGAALVLGIVLFSKLFCSFICPVGTVSEWIGKAGEKLKLRYTIKGYGDLLLRGLKYGILFITIYFTVTSSELFCKKFDPYYASLSGFNTDVVIMWAIISIGAVILGSFFIRLFWCKYLCPVGAISNIFTFFLTFSGVTAMYLLLLAAGLRISFVWPLTLICSLSFMFEFFTLKSKSFPLFRVRRNTDICTNCKVCSKICPQNIDVASVLVVRHIDCHLCSDCIQACPEKGALTINKNGKKWFPAVILSVLISAGLIAGRTFEIPTLTQYWGDISKKKEMKDFTKSGLKTVKCFGSSTTFANQMKRVKGVAGVTTFIRTNTVKVTYDPGLTDTVEIMKSIFSPVRIQIRKPDDDVRSLDIFRLRVDNFLDPLDAVYLKQVLSGDNEIYGFTTEFDCPVRINIYVDSLANREINDLKMLVETKETEQMLSNGKTMKVNLRFRVTNIEKDTVSIPVQLYQAIMYYEYRKIYVGDNLASASSYSLLFPRGGTEATNTMLEKLSYHLSTQAGILGIESVPVEGKPYLRVYFDKSKTDENHIHEAINSSRISIPDANGKLAEIENPLSFPFRGETIIK
jgi:polyferredoxin